MSKITAILRPEGKIDEKIYIAIGSLLVAFSFLDAAFNLLIVVNDTVSSLIALVIGIVGLFYIRTEDRKLFKLRQFNKAINSTNFNAFLTLICIFAIIEYTPYAYKWLFSEANFVGNSKEDCTGGGACWVFINVWFNKFIYGLYPNEETWRVNAAFIILLLTVGSVYLVNEKLKKYIILFLIFVFPFIALTLLAGGSFNLSYIPSTEWGGLALTFIISIFAMIFCFPLGVLLAMGRRSELKIIKYICIGFIEFWRGVPLITVLFMASVMFPMFLPDGSYVDKLVRCIVGITLFEAAYMAEVVRGGLQALPKGQYEAAKSIGMGYWKMNAFVILPQAIKLVIPGITNTFIALFKDTPLIFVMGLLEILGMINLAKTNPAWLGFAAEGYVFAALVFWIFCYLMSKYSQRLEQKLSTER